MKSQNMFSVKKKETNKQKKNNNISSVSLRKHAYSNILKISPPKTERFHKNSDTFYISAQNIDCR